MTGELFLTGATGYIGSSLLQTWLTDTGGTLNLLVRGKRDVNPKDRISLVLMELFPDTDPERFADRIRIVAGDVAEERFGLEEREYRDLAERTSHIIHCAAAARFDLEIEKARRINVGGTRNILDFARECGSIEKIDYIGTAYVAGRREGIVTEDELDVGQEHRNTYEASKFEAEKLVRESFGELPVSILRPSIVICDSRTGRASDFNGFYRALRMYWHGMLKFLPGNPASPLDLVPVDYVTEAAYAISNVQGSTGECYHLTAGPANPATLGEIAELAGRYFKREPFAVVPPEEFAASVSKMWDRLSEAERGMIGEIQLYLPYLTGGLLFDDSHTRRDTGLVAPPVRDYFEKITAYIMEHE
jgi:thioester reductase-like protein